MTAIKYYFQPKNKISIFLLVTISVLSFYSCEQDHQVEKDPLEIIKKIQTKEDIKSIVDIKPMFNSKNCLNLEVKLKQECSQNALIEHIQRNLKYPKAAKENNITGTCVVQFVVQKNGEISQTKLLRDIGAGCGGEALRVVNQMPPWNPALKDEKPVAMLFNLPIKFELE